MNTKNVFLGKELKVPHTGKIVWFYPNDNYDSESGFNKFFNNKGGRKFYSALIINGEDTSPTIKVITTEGDFILKSVPHKSAYQNSFVGYWDYIEQNQISRKENKRLETIRILEGAFCMICQERKLHKEIEMQIGESVCFCFLEKNRKSVSITINELSKFGIMDIISWVKNQFNLFHLWS